MVMVLIIITALVALIVPIIDSLRRTSDKATGAAGMMQLVDNVSLFRTLEGSYPTQFDSLLLDDDADGTVDGEYTGVKGADKWTPLALSDDEAASLRKSESGR